MTHTTRATVTGLPAVAMTDADTPDPRTMIALTDVTKVFKRRGVERPVLHEVSLTVRQGDIAAVIGPSGAGKTTLARCINLLEHPTSGHVSVAGVDLTQLSERELNHARRRIGTIFQASSLLMRQTAAENIGLPLRFDGWRAPRRRARVRELLSLVGLEDFADSHPRQLSGGQRQRVGIARALALSPEVLLSDEATSGLDPATTAATLKLLQKLRDELGLAIVLITHEMEVVREIATHVTLLRDGRVAEFGRVADLVRQPNSELGRGLLPDRPRMAGADGHALWEVTYASDRIRPDWIQHLGEVLSARVMVLGGVVETIDGHPAGRLTIAVDRPADVQAALRDSGLTAQLLVEASEVTSTRLSEAASA